jgi:alkanesulfonate monooxygenase SsuD/methylene tetrahydromethanopterin reductase-like flavin-dependent oxidoreductase (luciferase family)
VAPQELVGAARRGERLGFSELWFGEDCFFTGGISGAAVALSATEQIPIGLGIVSAVVRHPALLAMEISTLARIFPGRIWLGVGLGVPAWMRQMRALPKSPLTALRECVSAVRALLNGEEVSAEGTYYSFRNIRIAFPPGDTVPVYMGVNGPKMLQLSGEVADATVVSVLAGPRYIRWARDQIATGMEQGGRSGHHRVVAYCLFSVDRDCERAQAAVRPPMAFYLHAAGPTNALTQVAGISSELEVLIALGGREAVERELPSAWVDDLAVAGDPEECGEKILALLDAGADSVSLLPVPAERAEEIVELAAAEVLPRLR